jgi:cell division protein FtsB
LGVAVAQQAVCSQWNRSIVTSLNNPFIPPGQRVLALIYRNRRKLATGSAMMLAAVLGYFAVAGDNGLTVYKQKRLEHKQLASQIDDLKHENDQLQAHIGRLETDPHAIEHEAREKLHYARPGEVIYTIDDAHASQGGGSQNASPQPSNRQSPQPQQ